MTIKSRPLLAAVFFTMVGGFASAQAPYLVKNINTSTVFARGSFPFQFTQFGSNALFFAFDPVHGVELWKTDGTAAGTTFVKDVNPGIRNGSFFPIVISNGVAFFVGTDAAGTELWKSDGTTAGTFRVKDICPGACSANPFWLTDVNGTLYFTATTPANGTELWRSDGTQPGTVMVTDINPGFNSSNPSYLVNFKGTLFFAADDGVKGNELWSSAATTQMVTDIEPGPSSSDPAGLTVTNNLLFFAATHSGTTGTYAFSATTPKLLLNVAPAGFQSLTPAFLTVNGFVVFPASDPTTGTEMYATDGSPAGTAILGDIAPGTDSGVDVARGAAVLGSKLYFSGFDGSTHKVWTTNGKTISPFLATNNFPDSQASGFTAVGTTLYFAASASGSPDLFTSNGTPQGTAPVLPPPFGVHTPSFITAFNGGVLFAEQSTAEPWISHGTAATTGLLKDVNPDETTAFPYSFAGNGTGNVAFGAFSELGNKLWLSNGTTQGTVVINNAVGPPYTQPGGFTPPSETVFMNGSYFFAASASGTGRELWKSDGTSAGTVLVKDICLGPLGSSPGRLINFNGTLFFTANDNVHGEELWKSDGTEAGTVMVADIRPGSPSGFSSLSDNPWFTPIGSTLFFVANDGSAQQNQLFKTNGTAAGTVPITTTTSVGSVRTVTNLTASNGVLFLNVQGHLWKSDGTTATQLTSVALDNPKPIVDLNGIVIFRAFDPTFGIEIWRSNGTSAGTTRIADINTLGNSNVLDATADDPRNALVRFGNLVLFAATDGASGIELWKTDGNSAAIVKDICPFGCSSNPTNLTVAGNKLFFQANDGIAGEELWVTDGTSPGTSRLSDFEPGTGGSAPYFLTASGNLLYFTATTLALGEQLYAACAAPTTHYSLSASANVVSGAAFPLSVTPRDASSGLVPCYTGSAQLTSNDANASLPPPSPAVAGEGAHVLQPILRSMGSHSVTATDTVTNTITGTINVTVGASPATSTITGNPGAILANGTSTSLVTVQYKDADGNNLTSGGGTLTLSTDRGTLSAVTNNNNGTYRATLTSGLVSGPATISGILDGAAMTNAGVVQFLAGTAASLDVTLPATATTDVPFSMTVSARDSNGNVANTYSGTVHFTVTDTNATLPADYTFQPGDNGVHTFTNSVVLHTIGNRQIAATDIGTASINGLAIVNVNGATTTALMSSANPAAPNVTVTLTATVTSTALGGSPAGTVTFRDGATMLSTVPLSGSNASLMTSFKAGSHSLTATFNPGNPSFLASASSAVDQVATLAAPVILASYNGSLGQVSITFANSPGATSIVCFRSNNNTTWSVVASAGSGDGVIVDTPPAGQTWLYEADYVDADSFPGPVSNVDPATTITFDDDPLTASTSVKALHLTQARAGIDMFRTTVGLGAAGYTHMTIATGDAIRAVDWMEMRTRLDEARALVINLTAVPAYTDPAIATGLAVKGAHLNDFWVRMK